MLRRALLNTPRLLSSSSSTTKQSTLIPLKQRIKYDLKAVMFARKTTEISVLKSILSELTYAEKAKSNSDNKNNNGELKESAAMQVLQKMVRKRQESIEQYQAARREDLANKELAELTIIKNYLPEQMSVSALKSIVFQVMDRLQIQPQSSTDSSSPAASKQQFGLIMKEMRLFVDPAEAPASLVSQVVKDMLQPKPPK